MMRRSGILVFALLLLGGLSAAATAVMRGGSLEWVSDSLTYVYWSVERTPGYPAILTAVSVVSPSLRLLPWVQNAALILACVYFAIEVGYLLRSTLACVAVAIAIFANVYMMQYPLEVRPECFYITLALIHFGCVLRSFRSPEMVWPVLAGAALGLAILFRPVGYAMLFALPSLLIVWRDRRLLRGALLAVACALPILIACTGNYLVRGYFATQAFGGISLGMQVATMIPPRIESVNADALSRAYTALEPLRRAEARAGSWPMRDLVETVICGDTLAPVSQLAADIVDATPLRWKHDNVYWRETAMDAVAWDIATKSMALDPVAYLAKVARQLYGLWFLHQIIESHTATDLTALLDDTVGAAMTVTMTTSVKIVPNWVWVVKTLIFAAMLAAAVLVIVLAPFRRDPALRGLAYLALSTMCYFGVTAGVEVAISRYSLIAWPAQCAVLVGTVFLIRRFVTMPRTQSREGA